jgi:hypothetical protein
LDDETEEVRNLEAVELQVWLELDGLSRGLGFASVPHQLLSLLPPPPEAGWPLAFAQQRAAYRLTAPTQPNPLQDLDCDEGADYEALVGAGEVADGEASDAPNQEVSEWPPDGYTPVDECLPSRHRAHRLSYAIWSVLSEESNGDSYSVEDGEVGDVQLVLEAPSTVERLRLALLRMRDLAIKITPDAA